MLNFPRLHPVPCPRPPRPRADTPSIFCLASFGRIISFCWDLQHPQTLGLPLNQLIIQQLIKHAQSYGRRGVRGHCLPKNSPKMDKIAASHRPWLRGSDKVIMLGTILCHFFIIIIAHLLNLLEAVRLPQLLSFPLVLAHK